MRTLTLLILVWICVYAAQGQTVITTATVTRDTTISIRSWYVQDSTATFARGVAWAMANSYTPAQLDSAKAKAFAQGDSIGFIRGKDWASILTQTVTLRNKGGNLFQVTIAPIIP